MQLRGLTSPLTIVTCDAPVFSFTVEEAELAEPIVASLPQQDNKMILLSWSSSYLLEKDIKDKLTEKLELSSLMSLESQAVSGSVDAGTGDEKVELTLRFDYINKDRQRRFYLLDVADSKVRFNKNVPSYSTSVVCGFINRSDAS